MVEREERDKMSYQKCYYCNHCYRYYKSGEGLMLFCKMTERQLLVIGCTENEEKEM